MRKRERCTTSRVQRARSSERPCPTLGPVPVQRRYYHLGRLHRGHSDGFTMFTRALWNPFEQQRHLNFLKGATDIFLLFVCYAFIEFLFALDFICKNISCLLAMCWPCVTAHQQDTKTDEKYIFEPIAETPSWVLWPLRRWLNRLRIASFE
jgi:hypothetical protein